MSSWNSGTCRACQGTGRQECGCCETCQERGGTVRCESCEGSGQETWCGRCGGSEWRTMTTAGGQRRGVCAGCN